MQGRSGPQMAEAVGLAIRDVCRCCDLSIQQQIIAKKAEEKNLVNSDVCNCCIEPLGRLGMDGMECQHVTGVLKETLSGLQDYPGPKFIMTKITVFGNQTSK